MSRAPRHPFPGLRPPSAPAELRRCALAAAHAVPPEPSGEPARDRRSLTDRLWENRPLRLAWVLLFLALLGTNAFLDARGNTAPPAHAEATRSRTTLLDAHAVLLRAVLDEPALPAPRRGSGRSS